MTGPGGLGATHFDWDGDVEAVVRAILAEFPQANANTYNSHPWAGWDGRSIDFWGRAGRGHAIDKHIGYAIRARVMRMSGAPYIRHLIYRHSLWTSWGGYSFWEPDDHSGKLRHVHVTYWRS